MSKVSTKIIFVYNAKSGISNALLDYGKKYITPSKYDCQLCMLSYGAFGMKSDWKSFVASLPHPVVFLHKDEFEHTYSKIKTPYPAMLIAEENTHQILIDGKDFVSINSLNELKSRVSKALVSTTN